VSEERPGVCHRCRRPLADDDATCPSCDANRPAKGWPADPRIGQSLLGGVVVRQRIGSGGSGSIYRAEDPGTGKRLAVKFLHPEMTSDPELVRRFRMEAVLTKTLAIPQVVRTFDFGEGSDGTLYLTMEYVDGLGLDRIIANRGALPLNDALEVARQVLVALAVAHSRCIVHRDLKPGNILLTTDPEGRQLVKILDFGFAKLVADSQTGAAPPVKLTRVMTVLGTPTYMSPEQGAGVSEVDGRADLYSVGALLYRMVTGCPPFEAESAEEMMKKHAAERPEPPSSRKPGLPPAIDRIVLRLLEKDPAQRYPNAAAVIEDLDREFPSVPHGWSIEDLASRAVTTSTLMREVQRHFEDASEAVAARRVRIALWVAGGVLLAVAAAILAWQIVT
jgi:serine/threonine-protein kinase